MADRSFKVYIGEDLSPVIDLTDRIDWPNVEATMAAEAGEVGVGSVPVRDEAGSLSLPVRNRAEWVQGSNVLWRGRVQAVDYSRQIQVADRARHQSVTVDDYNIDLQGIPVDSFVRSSETDVARVQGLVADYLSGNPRTTTNLNGSNYVSSSNTVTLAAKTYSNTEPLDILREIALETDKEFFVDVDGNLHYDGHDSLAFACPYYITDRPEEHDADPTHALTLIPNMGPVTSLEGQELSSHVRVYYTSDDYREAGNPTVETNHAYWTDTFHIEGITASQAQAIANTLSARRAFPGRSYAMTVGNANGGPLTDEQIGSIKAGMMIRIKARVTPDAPDAFLWRRIRELTWSTPAPGQHYAHLRLDKRLLTQPRTGPLGPQPPSTGTAPTVLGSVHLEQDSGGPNVDGLNVSTSDSTLYAVWLTHDGITSPTAHYRPDPSSSLGEQAMTLVHTETHSTPSSGENTDNETIYVFRLVNPTADGSAGILFSGSGTHNGWAVGAWLVSGTASASYVSAEGLGTSSSVTPTGAGASDLVLDAVGWRIWSIGDASNDPAVTGGQTEDWGVGFNSSPGQPDMAWGGSHKVGTGARTWSWTTSTNWVAVAIIVAGVAGDEVSDVGSGTTGSNGTPGVYAPIDHVHAHGSHTDATDYHDADQVSIDDAGGYFTGTNVEAALQELGAAGSGPAVVTDHGSMGATETFDFGDGSDHEGVQDANLTVTLTGATTGQAAWLTLVLTQDSGGSNTLTLPGSVVNATDIETAWDLTGDAVNVLTLFTYDGGTTWYGFLAGGAGGGASALDDLTDVTITSPAEGDMLRYNGSAWVNSSGRWEPVVFDGEIVFFEDDIVMHFVED